ncbi:MAG: DUF2125 domain-containing protein [Alphaproteobacteria bacterium]|nr:MAG: DUF2125 domain-containing protein [Alphaproteobacteria bacterium]
MRKLNIFVALFVVAGLAWGAYWWAGASALERGLAAWLEARRAEGWVASAERLEVHGFPNRFDTTFSGLSLADPHTRVAWTAPDFRLFALSYRPNRLIALWPGPQTFATPDGTFELQGEPFRASFALGADRRLTLGPVTFELGAARILSDKGQETRLDWGQFSMRPKPISDNPKLYDVYLDVTGLTPDPSLRAALPGGDRLPEQIAHLRLSGSAEFDRPWDRRAIEERRPQPRRLVIDELSAEWGGLLLQARGTLDIGPGGLPEGELQATARNWREILRLAEASGALDADRARTLHRALGVVAALSGDPDTLDFPIRFSGGLASIGPVPIGPAPRLDLP